MISLRMSNIPGFAFKRVWVLRVQKLNAFSRLVAIRFGKGLFLCASIFPEINEYMDLIERFQANIND